MMGHGLGKDKATVSKTVLSGRDTHMLHHKELSSFTPIPDFPEYLVSEDARVRFSHSPQINSDQASGRSSALGAEIQVFDSPIRDQFSQ